jgi:hypothetical protein
MFLAFAAAELSCCSSAGDFFNLFTASAKRMLACSFVAPAE